VVRRTKTFLIATTMLLLSMAMPSSSAAGQCFSAEAAVVCYSDNVYDSGAGSACPSSGDTWTGMTQVVVYAPGREVQAWGRTSCGTSDYGTTNEDLIAVAYYSPDGNAAVAWYHYSAPWGEQCSTYAASGIPAAPFFQDVGCPVGPPVAPGWGHLLP
jgi:hypothetical protein